MYSFYGANVVEKFIKSAVIHTASLELNEISDKPNKQMTNPLYLLQQTISNNKGHFDTSATPLEGMWCVKITCKLTDQSNIFSHARNAPSKQKAKTEAAQDILTFFNGHPELFEQLKTPATRTDEYALPITPDMFYQLSNVTSRQSSTCSIPSTETSMVIDSDETVQRLSELLLNGSQQVESNKRLRQSF